ncbi:uncharacterized protein N7487_009856 [Penicillium crustosum]|uniref:uncharacterized protein n=1 Tax=Penicillium crustosum TaxID=36656 RepID=UPI00238B25AA|nr:uncharacterized protein N7487_009856 [Penicillium crustosum]KAJ5395553.1 hypothetical protein N7487_009856 [Penicillium crustosum]
MSVATHPAVIAPGIKQPLKIEQITTPNVQPSEVRIRVEWVPSAPLDVFQVDAGLMASFPQSLGDTAAGTVTAIGSQVDHLNVGDKAFGFFFHNEKEKAQQIYATVPKHLLGKVPEGVSLKEAATLPNNFCTAFITLRRNLGIDLPWPHEEEFVPSEQHAPILVWGASTSVGQYAVQILKHWGYSNVLATASPRHHDKIKRYGARQMFDYQDSTVVESIKQFLEAEDGQSQIRVFDCVDSKFGSLRPISKIAVQPGSVVAALLPVVINAPSVNQSDPSIELAFDVSTAADWAHGVEVHSIASYGYEEDAFLRDHLQRDIMPTLLGTGAIEPNSQRVVEGRTLLERATKALGIMRSGTVSGERLVWRVWTPEEFPEFQ